MPLRLTSSQLQPLVRTVLFAAALTALLAPSAASAMQSRRVAKEVRSPDLERTVLADNHGRTLYTLSAESKTRFICTRGCLSTWRPLLVAAAVKPTGPVKLGTVARPDGRTQVSFKGRPLYRFAGDTRAGEAHGEGIRDVGTWHATVIAGEPTPAAPPPQPAPESPYPY